MTDAKSPLKNILISNVFGTINRGDALLVESLMDEIKTVFPKGTQYFGVANRPDLQRQQLPEICWSQQPGRSDSSNMLKRRLENTTYMLGTILYVLMNAPKRFPRFLLPLPQQTSILNIKKADLIISCPGGFLVEETLPIIVNSLQLWAAQKFKRKVVLAPQTIGPIQNSFVRKFCAKLLRGCEIIIVREDFSYDFVTKELQVDKNKVIRGVDMALSHKKSNKEAGIRVIRTLGFKENEQFLGASVIQWVFPNCSNPQQSQMDYEKKLAQIFTRIYTELGLRTLVFNQVSADLEAAKRVQKLAGNFVIVDEDDREVSVMRSMIGHSRIFLGSRLHSCIFSILEHVPATALSYNYKTDGIMQDIGQSQRVWKIENFQVGDVFDALKHDLEFQSERSREIEQGLNKINNDVFKSALLKLLASKN